MTSYQKIIKRKQHINIWQLYLAVNVFIFIFTARARYKNGNKHKVYPDNFATAPYHILKIENICPLIEVVIMFKYFYS